MINVWSVGESSVLPGVAWAFGMEASFWHNKGGSDQRGTHCRLPTHRGLTTRAVTRGRCHCAQSPIEGICRATALAQANRHGAEKSHRIAVDGTRRIRSHEPRHLEEPSIERDESRDVGMTASVKVHHDASR